MKLDKIDSLEVYMVKLPLVTAFETSFDVETKKEALLLRIKASGIEGWGECVSAPNPYYSPETNHTAFHIIKDFTLFL